MDRPATPRCQPFADSLVPRAIELPEAATAHAETYQTYHSGRSTPSDDTFSDTEFGFNYTTSKPKPFSTHNRRFEYSECVPRVASPFESRVEETIPRYIKPLRKDNSLFHNEDIESSSIGRSSQPYLLGSYRKYETSRHHEYESKPGSLSARIDTTKTTAAAVTSVAKEATGATVLPKALSHKSVSQRISGRGDSATSLRSGQNALEKEDVAASRPGPVFNLYPQPERRQDIESAIVTVDKAFDLSKATEQSVSRVRVCKQTSKSELVDATFSHTSKDQNEKQLQSKAYAIANGKTQRKTAAPVDGNDRGQAARNKSGALSSFGGNGGSALLQRQSNTGGDQQSGRRGPPDEEDTSKIHSLAGTNHVKRFPCVFHHPEDPSLDATLECKTLKEFVSQQLVHHGGNNHRFYYCATCFETFKNEDERKAHDRRCEHKKCVTEGCLNYGTFFMATCNHPGKGRQNSQWSIWKELRRLARPDEDFFDFGVSELRSNISATPDAMTPANRYRHSGNHEATPASSSSQRPSSVSQRIPMTPDSSPISPRIEELEALASSLLLQLETPEPEGFGMVQDMYGAYIGSVCPTLLNSGQPFEAVGRIQGLHRLIGRLWVEVQNPGNANPEYIRKLVAWAHRILPKQGSVEVSPPATQSMLWRPQVRESPAAAAAARCKGKQQSIESSAAHYSDHSAGTMGQTVSSAPMASHAFSVAYQEFGQSQDPAQPNSINPRNIIQTPQPSVAAIFPFMPPYRDATFNLQGHQNTPSTSDSGYGTGSREKSSNFQYEHYQDPFQDCWNGD